MSEKDDGRPERPKIIPIFGKRPPLDAQPTKRRRLNDEEVQDWLSDAAVSGRWMIVIWYLDADGRHQYRRKNSENYPPVRDVRKMLTQIEEDDKIQAMVHRADVEVREHDTGFAPEE